MAPSNIRDNSKAVKLFNWQGITMTRSFIGFGLVCLLMTGCQKESPRDTFSSPQKSESAAPTKVTIALNWTAEAEHGGFYAALVHGFFKEEGLDVTIKQGGPGAPVIQDVATNRTEFAVDNADKLLLLRAQEADVVAVMSPIQNSPRCIMVHKKLGLNRLDDLTNAKPITLSMNQGQPFAQYLLKKLKPQSVQVVPFAGGVATFLGDENYGQQAYSFSEPFVAEKQGGDPQSLMLTDIGFNTYTSVLLTNRDIITKQPELVEKVTRASVRGWRKYLTEPEETNKHINQQNPAMDLDILAYGVSILKPLCIPEGFDEARLGSMTPERWQTLVDQLVEIGSIKAGQVKAEDAYSLNFLPK